MRQWTTALLNDYLLDQRCKEDILNKIQELSASYTPEWQFDTENPDIGSCIALLFSDEMLELIKRYNMTTERNCVELVNMLNISLKQAYPAQGIVLMGMIDSSVPGVRIPKGIKLLADNSEDERIVFETANAVYLTNSHLKAVFMTSGKDGNVYPIKGNFKELNYIEAKSAIVKEETEVAEHNEFIDSMLEFVEGIQEIIENTLQKEKTFPFRLFDFNRESYGLHGMLLYHGAKEDIKYGN